MADSKGSPPHVVAPAARISGTGSRPQSGRVLDAVTRGIGDGLRADDLARGGPLDLGNLTLRLPHGAGSREIERAVRDAMRKAQR
ncbi:MAG TPA: hypothetical protein VGB91_02450 [Rhizomicrobium sp.]